MSRKTIGVGMAMAVSVAVLAGCGTTTTKTGTAGHPKKIVVGFSEATTSNNFHIQQDQYVNALAKKMKASGKINGFYFENANSSTSTQISQIDDLILKHVNLLLIDPTSPTALNGVIQKAHNAGITVVVFNDGPVTSPIPYELEANNASITETYAKYVAQRLHGHGNVLLVRGLAGYETDKVFYKGMLRVLKHYPGIKIVDTVYGNWTEGGTESAVSAVLPSLPKINAVITEGSESYGAAQAFAAAGRPIPIIPGGNRAYFFRWWSQQAKKNGYHTMSLSSNPWMAAAAFYVGIDIMNGMKVPKNMTMPNLEITQSQLPYYAKNVKLGQQAAKAYNGAWVIKHIIH